MYALKDIISKFIEKNPEISKQCRINLNDIWKEVVGDVISEISSPNLLKDKTLEVLVKNSTWMNQLRLMKKDIINKFNITVGGNFIEEIEFKLDRRKNKKIEVKCRTEHSISDEIIEKINQSLKNVKDKDLKELLKNIFMKSYVHQ